MLRAIFTIRTVLLTVFLLIPIVCQAQFKEVPVDAGLAGRKDAILGGVRGGGQNKEELAEFLKNYYLGRWTVQGNARDLHLYRKELQTDIDSIPAANKEFFITEVVRQLSAYAASNDCFPACRYNAILAIATLDLQTGTPYPGVLKRLGDFCDSDKVALPDYVRLGALVGLVRQAELGIEDEANKQMVQELFLKIVSPQYAKEKKYRAEIMNWFELKATDGLRYLKTAGGPKHDSETLDAFRLLLENPKKDIEVRALAARGIGSLSLDSVKGYDMAKLAESFVKIVRDFYTEENKYIGAESLRDQIKSGTGGSMMGGMGGSPMGGAMGGSSSMGGPPMGGMSTGGSSMGMPGGMGMGMGNMMMSEQTINKINDIIARVKFDLSAILIAISGEGEKKGLRAAIPEDDANSLALLDRITDEIKSTFTFLDNGPDDSATTKTTTKTTPRPNPRKAAGGAPNIPPVDIPLIKDHVNAKVVEFNELLGGLAAQ